MAKVKQLPDISEYYTGKKAINEEINWIENKDRFEVMAKFIYPYFNEIHSIIEYGCGTGHLAKLLPTTMRYIGYEKNDQFLKWAKKRNEGIATRTFFKEDVRTVHNNFHDLGMAWGLLKHFGLFEWDSIVERILANCKFGAFDVQLYTRDMDNGKDYHHVFVTEERVQKAVGKAGHKILYRENLSEFEIENETCENVAFWTERVHGE